MIRKTQAMLEVEARFDAPLQTLIPATIAISTRDSDAAGRLGILPTTLSHWISRLQIHDECAEARTRR